MKKAMKAVTMALLYGNNFPISERVVSEDPEYCDTCEELEKTMENIKEKFTDDEYEQVASLIALMEIKDGYQYMEYFHTGLLTGFDLRDTIHDNKTKLIIRNMIR